MDTNQSSKQFTTTSAVTVIDLTTMPGVFGVSDVFNIADFDIEVVGNDAAVTMEAKGPFGNSAFFALTDNSFAIAGGKRNILGYAVAQLRFTRSGTTSYNINIVRRFRA